MVTPSAAIAAKHSRAGFSFPAARNRCRRRSSATCATRCLPRSSSPATCIGTENETRGALRRQPHRRARCAAHACRRSASPRSGWARAAARGWRAAIRGCSPRRSRCSSISPASMRRRDHGRAARHRMSRRRTRRRERHRRRHRAAAPARSPTPRRASATSRASRSSAREFHLAVAEASHNRVLVVQLISLQHVSWPRRNPTLTPKVMRRIQDVHKELLGLIEIRDAAGARQADGRPRQDDPRPPGAGDEEPLNRHRREARTRNPEPRERCPGFRFAEHRASGMTTETIAAD